MLVAILLASMASPAFASAKLTAVATTPSTTQKENESGWNQLEPSWGRRDEASSEDKQSACVSNYSVTNTTYTGSNSGNFGNQGNNGGYIQANADNNGNQMTHRGEISGQHRTNQSLCSINGSSTNTLYTGGENQGNFGNQGFNRGYIQDNTDNSGNQMTN